jgi:hypothetical protein
MLLLRRLLESLCFRAPQLHRCTEAGAQHQPEPIQEDSQDLQAQTGLRQQNQGPLPLEETHLVTAGQRQPLIRPLEPQIASSKDQHQPTLQPRYGLNRARFGEQQPHRGFRKAVPHLLRPLLRLLQRLPPGDGHGGSVCMCAGRCGQACRRFAILRI